MTLLEILDAAVKIGLGGLISGMATYFVSKLNHEKELRKFSLVRRIESLEQTSAQSEQFFGAWLAFVSKLGGIYKGQRQNGVRFI